MSTPDSLPLGPVISSAPTIVTGEDRAPPSLSNARSNAQPEEQSRSQRVDVQQPSTVSSQDPNTLRPTLINLALSSPPRARPIPEPVDDELPPPQAATFEVPTQLTSLATTDTVGVASATKLSEVDNRPIADPEIDDLGWNEHPSAIPSPLVGGLPNEQFWTLVRRFNKQMYQVRAIPQPPDGELDLRRAEEEEFSPDKLRAHVERLYMTVVIGFLGFKKHIARLRSWNEPSRTAVFCIIYFFAWASNLLIACLLSLLVLLLLHRPSRAVLFPPAPLALVSSSSGNLQTPRAGTLGSGDSLTGAMEKHPGEAVEQEASNFVTAFATLAVGTVLGKHPDGDEDEDEGKRDAPFDQTLPDPTSIAATGVDVKDTAQGKKSGVIHDRTKQPVEVLLWTKARPAMMLMADITDLGEMFSNAISPVPPFNDHARYKLATMLAPLILAFALFDSAFFAKLAGLATGAWFFGRPVLHRGEVIVRRKFPRLRKLVEDLLDFQKTLLRGVPTNAQLTLTILRLGEANRSPLPPPLTSASPPDSRLSTPIIEHADLPADLQASELELNPPPSSAPPEAHGAARKTDTKHRFISKLAGILRGGTKAGVGAALVKDKVKAAFGSEDAKARLGILPGKRQWQSQQLGQELVDGPSVFTARYEGKKGLVLLSSTPQPVLAFLPQPADRATEPVFTLPLASIRSLKKLGGLGWKGKLVVGWAFERPVYDALEIGDARGATWVITAVGRRDELFNRLIAADGQWWECA